MKLHKDVMAHASDGDVHAVSTQLHVLIAPESEGRGFIARGVEVDYLSSGETIEEARSNFVEGLCRTIQSYLRRGQSLERFRAKNPQRPEVQSAYLASDQHHLDCVAVFDLRERMPESKGFYQQLKFCQTDTLLFQ